MPWINKHTLERLVCKIRGLTTEQYRDRQRHVGVIRYLEGQNARLRSRNKKLKLELRQLRKLCKERHTPVNI